MGKYSYVVNEETNRVVGICRKGWLNKIKDKEQGNLLDSCVEQERTNLVKSNAKGSINYLSPSRDYYVNVTTGENGKINSVEKYSSTGHLKDF